MGRPYVLLSCAMSVDGFIDDTFGERLLLSNDADFDRVDALRAESDAIMIGAETLRRDNPRLLVKSEARRAAREAQGLPPYPLKVTITATGNLDPELKFWHYGGGKLVYAPDAAAARLRGRLGKLAEVAATGETLAVADIVDDLGARGIGKLMVDSITARDYIQVQASIVVLALIFVLVNLATDLTYAALDPRIRYG